MKQIDKSNFLNNSCHGNHFPQLKGLKHSRKPKIITNVQIFEPVWATVTMLTQCKQMIIRFKTQCVALGSGTMPFIGYAKSMIEFYRNWEGSRWNWSDVWG